MVDDDIKSDCNALLQWWTMTKDERRAVNAVRRGTDDPAAWKVFCRVLTAFYAWEPLEDFNDAD